MDKRFILTIAIMLSATQIWAQLTRSDEFHNKYTLTGVAVFSRHNIRAPMAEAGSFINRITPHKWHDFGVNSQELTMKGGILETTNGQFFKQWVVSEGLFPENAEPADDEIYVLSNSKQRTISTARHFVSSFMPMKTVTVNHKGQLNNMDVDFTLNLDDDITQEEWAQIKTEYDSAYNEVKIREACEKLKPNFQLLSDVLDVENSDAYKDGSFKGFTDFNDTIDFSSGAEPAMKGILSKASTACDALFLQFYEEPDAVKAAFGKDLTYDQWKMLTNIIYIRDEIRFSSPFVQRYVSKHQRQLLAEGLQAEGRKFTFLCGHDTNIHNILKALRTKEYATQDAIEIGTPIGSKIVFEKWTDASGNAFVAVNLVYQTVDELHNNTLLNLTTRPNIVPLQFEGLDANEDGLIPLDKMISRLTDQDVSANVSKIESVKTKSETEYTIQGLPANSNYRGIVIKNGKKSIW